MSTRVLVTGAGGFLGHHIASHLNGKGYWVRGVDIREPAYAPTAADEFHRLDLRDPEAARRAVSGVDEVYALAADMGGMGYLAEHQAKVLRNNMLITVNTVDAAWRAGVTRLLYASSACVYPEARQADVDAPPLREEEAFPAAPQDAYGWEKLTGELLCRHYREELGMPTRIVRLHNVYGPLGAWDNGREKAPAAICRKVAAAKLSNRTAIEVWGDGRQRRSFCYVDDCVEGMERVMRSEVTEPLNLGSDFSVSVDELVAMVAAIAGVRLRVDHVPGPQGVRGRNSDNTRLRRSLGWVPPTSLEDGLAATYRWIEAQVWEMLGGPRRASVAAPASAR